MLYFIHIFQLKFYNLNKNEKILPYGIINEWIHYTHYNSKSLYLKRFHLQEFYYQKKYFIIDLHFFLIINL